MLALRPETESFESDLPGFCEFGTPTHVARDGAVPVYTNEFWTSKQRAASSLHEVSYRACFKPQLPRFFIERLTWPGDTVYDPFMGRGTTLVEAGLLGRRAAGCDVNPLSATLVGPRLRPPTLEQIATRLAELSLANELTTSSSATSRTYSRPALVSPRLSKLESRFSIQRVFTAGPAMISDAGAFFSVEVTLLMGLGCAR